MASSSGPHHTEGGRKAPLETKEGGGIPPGDAGQPFPGPFPPGGAFPWSRRREPPANTEAGSRSSCSCSANTLAAGGQRRSQAVPKPEQTSLITKTSEVFAVHTHASSESRLGRELWPQLPPEHNLAKMPH